MNTSLFLTFLVVVLLSPYNHKLLSLQSNDISYEEAFEHWSAKYGRIYPTKPEYYERLGIFKNNLEYIRNINNAGNNTYKLGLNEFSDLTHDEFIAAYTGFKNPGNTTTSSSFTYANVMDVPTSMDWREKGAVTPAKHQGVCGSCWVFAAIATMEGINQITTGKLVSLSEQQVIDCTDPNRQTCKGGFMAEAFDYTVENRGLISEENYTYQGKQESCKINTLKQGLEVASISSYLSVPPNNEGELLKAVSRQPVGVAIEVSESFRHYQSGVLTGDCGANPNHEVVVVGFGTSEDGLDYWLIKNSWGQGWGDNGFIKIQRNVNALEGFCGIAIRPVYPVIYLM